MRQAGPAVHPVARRQAAAVRQASVLQWPVLCAIVGLAALAGGLATTAAASQHAVAVAGPELTRLLRGMAAIKTLAAAGLTAAVLWRLALPAAPVRLAAYGVGCAAMAAGPGLIWDMAQIRLGALLLHAGLFATVVLLWRDPATARHLGGAVERRRRAVRARSRAG